MQPGLDNINMTIPNSNFQDNNGTFNVSALPVPKNTKLFFGMSDATGAVSGGTTSLMTVGDSLTGQSCNTTTPGAYNYKSVAASTKQCSTPKLANDFFYSTENTLTQCGDFSFTNYPLAAQPLTIFVRSELGAHPWLLLNALSCIGTYSRRLRFVCPTPYTPRFRQIQLEGQHHSTDASHLFGDRYTGQKRWN